MSKFKHMVFKADNQDHSYKIQKALFALGYTWFGGKVCQYLDASYIFTRSDGGLTYSNTNYLDSSNDYRLTTLEELTGYKKEPVTTFNPESTISQFFNQLQERLSSIECCLYIYGYSIQLANLGNDDVANINSYEELLDAIKVKEDYLKVFKGE